MLLVEDNATDVFVIEEVLAGSGLNVTVQVAENGEDALRYFEDLWRDDTAVCPALVLLDLNLPKVGGIDVLRRLRSAPRCKQTPVIIVTSSSAEKDRVATRELGADAYFQKPSDLNAYMKLGDLIAQILPSEDEPNRV